MKLSEICTTVNLAESKSTLDYSDVIKKIKKQFDLIGYKKIGGGGDATVWAPKDISDFAIKFIVSSEDDEIAEKIFNDFYEYCKSHKSNPHLPKFHETNTVEIDGVNYLQIDMERLIDIKDQFIEALVWHFSDYACNHKSWKEVCDNLGTEKDVEKSEDTWRTYKASNLGIPASRLNKIDTKKMVERFINEKNQYKKLYYTMCELLDIGKEKSFGWDLHTKNVMQRPNGEIVIIDPWFGEFSQ